MLYIFQIWRFFTMTTKINTVIGMTSTHKTTYEGGKGYEPTFKETLAEFFSLGLLNGNFYQSQEEVLKHGKFVFERALMECPEFATKAAIYGNNVNSLKLVPTIWLVYVSTLEDKSLFKAAFPRIIRNPKMLHDFMEIARKGGVRKGLGRSIKKVMNDWMLENLNEYQASRNKGKLSEIVKLTRPSFQNKDFQNFMKYIAKDELTFERAVALKEVIQALQEGVVNEKVLQLIETHRLQLEELKHATKNLSSEDKKQVYEKIYKGLNYAALILNLVALERVFATKTKKKQTMIIKDGRYQPFTQKVVVETDIPQSIIDMVSSRITDLELYRKSNMLPFALLNAERMVVTSEFKQAIAKMFRQVAEETFTIDPSEKLMLGIDTSASMSCPVTDTGSLRAIDVATLFGALIKKSHTQTNVFAVATTMKEVPVHKQDDVFEMARKIEKTNVGYGTYFEQIMKHYNGEKYVILITDSQQADNLEKKWLEASKPDGAKLIVWQLKPYYTRISEHPSVVYVYGYSDRLLGLITNIIEGKAGQIEEIEKICL
jgi:hypothetical protein